MLTINLKETGSSISRTNVEADLLTLADEVRAANEDLNTAGLALAALDKTARELEEAAEFSKAVAQKDNSLGAVVAQEMVSIALSNINQDHLAGELVPANEDITVAEEGIKDTLKNVWEKVKEYAKKAWEFIRNLVMKVVDFVKGIFGKEGATGDELDKLLKKLDKEKRTVLEDKEFPEATAKRLADKVKVILVEKDKKLAGSDYVNFIDEQYKLVSKVVNNVDNAFPSTPAVDITKNTIAGINVGDSADYQALALKVWEDLTGQKEIKAFELNDGIKDAVADQLESTLDKYKAYYLSVVGKTPTKATILVVGLKEDGDVVKSGMTKDDFNSFIKNLEVSAVVVDIPADEYKDKYENIVPLDFPEASSVAKELKEKGKKAAKDAEKVQKQIDKKAKEVEKEINKQLKDANSDNDVHNFIKTTAHRMITLYTNKAKESAKGYSETLMSLARSTIGDIVKESARLYKKA